MDLRPLSPLPRRSGLLAVEKATLAYTLLTALLAALLWPRLHSPQELILGRALVVAGMAAVLLIYIWRPARATLLLRYLYPLTLLAYWYPDTYEFCHTLGNMDPLFARADEWLFGCQPALTFREALPGRVWSELFHLGYFSYYPLIALTVCAPLVLARRQFGRTVFVVMACFFLYYTIYLFLPVAGPQFYFPVVGDEAVRAGEFPAVGHYFSTHAELAATDTPPGLFRDLVEAAQASGERPTAAFPSSHVGISTVLMLLLWRLRRPLALSVAPLYVLLCCSTVYIEAHYAVDVVGGLVTAVAFYALSAWLFPRMAGPIERNFNPSYR